MAKLDMKIPLDQAERQVLTIQSQGQGPVRIGLNGVELGSFASLKEAHTAKAFRLPDGRTVSVQLHKHGLYWLWQAQMDGRLVLGSARQHHQQIWTIWLVGGVLGFIASLFHVAEHPELMTYLVVDLAISVTMALLLRACWIPAAWIGAGLHVISLVAEWLAFFAAVSAGAYAASTGVVEPPPVVQTILVVFFREAWLNAKWAVRVMRDLKYYRQVPAGIPQPTHSVARG